MKQKKKPGRLSCLLILGLVLILALGTVPVEAKSITWNRVNPYLWSNSADDSYYIKEGVLYRLAADQPKAEKFASWKLKSNQSLSMVYAYNNRLYVGIRNSEIDTKAGPLYCVDTRTGKKTKAISACDFVCAGGQYLYGYKVHVADPMLNPQPLYRWKISGNRMKAAGKVGNRIGQILVDGKKVYYAAYGQDGVKEMTVFQSSLNGSGRKTLFSLKASGPGGIAQLSGVEKGKVGAFVIDDVPGHGTTEYEYDIKTGKLSIMN